MTIGERIKKYRTEKGLTQKQLGALCGMSESQIGQYENGYRNPNINNLQKIAKALDTTVGRLIGEKNPSEDETVDKVITELNDKYYEIYKDLCSLAESVDELQSKVCLIMANLSGCLEERQRRN